MHEVVQRRPAHAEHLRRLDDVAVHAAEHRDDRALLGLVAHLAQVERGEIVVGAFAAKPRSAAVIWLPSAMITARLMQFSSSRTLPGHACASIAAIASERSVIERAALLGGEALHEGVRQQRRVARARAQRRDVDDDLRQAVVEVLAEAAVRDQRLQVLVRRADDAHVDRDLVAAADALDHALLQEAQQLGLQRERQVADLVEEQRAAVGRLDLADRLPCRAGERALLVAEQLALEQVLGNRGAVDRDEALAAPRRQVVQRAREQLLAGAAFAQQQDGRAGARDLLDRRGRSAAARDRA